MHAAGSVKPVAAGPLAAALPKLRTYDADTQADTDARRRRARKDAAAAEAAG
ncbi:hypothetical protein GCM10010446_11490 [Streptomyces enissocaesilis]|uniref:Uncharacterized protein n=1 Tax=Streptomyces enissocaesilis TaxID=332589 RepID=A0ABP6JEY2_9ACTN